MERDVEMWTQDRAFLLSATLALRVSVPLPWMQDKSQEKKNNDRMMMCCIYVFRVDCRVASIRQITLGLPFEKGIPCIERREKI